MSARGGDRPISSTLIPGLQIGQTMYSQAALVLLALLGHLPHVLRKIRTSASVQVVLGHVAIDLDRAGERSGDFHCRIHADQRAFASEVPLRSYFCCRLGPPSE